MIADTGAIHLAQVTPQPHLRAIWLCYDMLTVDTVTGGTHNQEGKTYATEVTGLGVEPKMDVLAQAIARSV